MTLYAKFSAEDQFIECLRNLGLSITQFHAYQYDTPLGRSTLEKVVSGARRLDRDEAARITALCKELQSLQSDCEAPVNWARIREIRELLQLRRDGATDCYISFKLTELRAAL